MFVLAKSVRFSLGGIPYRISVKCNGSRLRDHGRPVPVLSGNRLIERPAVRPAPMRRTGCNRSTRTASAGLRRPHPARAQTQRRGSARPQPPAVFWSFRERCNRAFAQQLCAAVKGPPETLCSERCGRGRAGDPAVQRVRSVSDGLRQWRLWARPSSPSRRAIAPPPAAAPSRLTASAP
jgi:hypothetical protein